MRFRIDGKELRVSFQRLPGALDRFFGYIESYISMYGSVFCCNGGTYLWVHGWPFTMIADIGDMSGMGTTIIDLWDHELLSWSVGYGICVVNIVGRVQVVFG